MTITVNELWDELRDKLCATGRKATTIVQLRRPDLKAAMDAIETRKRGGSAESLRLRAETDRV